MNVKTILAAKGSDVAVVSGSTHLIDAAFLMRKQKIGSVVITGAGNKPIGIFTERDFNRKVIELREDAFDLSVAEVMTRSPVTCTAETTLEEAMDVVTKRKFRHLPVVDESGALCGLVSIGDLVKTRVEEIEREAEAQRHYIRTGGGSAIEPTVADEEKRIAVDSNA